MTKVIAGRFEVYGLAGRGGEGEVFRARDRATDTYIALKRTATSSVALDFPNHDGLPQIDSTFEWEGRSYVVMEWIEGLSLEQLLIERGEPGLPFERVCDWISSIASALEHLHANSIVHGDVKPGNVILTDDEHVVLVDLGSSAGVGTRGFAAPEGAIGPVADVFGLAATAHALFTGRPPLGGDEHDWSCVPSTVRKHVVDAIRGGLSIDPTLRPDGPASFVASILRAPGDVDLRQHASTFIGRRRELDRIYRASTASRLVTLVGTGGVGKTRLAIEAATRMAARFSGGVRFAGLAGVDDAGLLSSHVARSIGLRETPGVDAVEALAFALGQAPVLLVLDNCEHLTESCSVLVATLLDRCGALSILATSRRPLEIAAEVAVAVPPLPADTDAVALLSARAELEVLDDASREFAMTICRRVGGLPLAIELAASAMSNRDLGDLAARVASSIGDTLGSRSGDDVAPHQMSLDATIRWSFDQIGDAQETFVRLGAFASLARPEAIASVTHAELPSTHRAVATLLTHGLVVELDDGCVSLLEPVRDFALRLLEGSGSLVDARRRHLAWYRDLAEQRRSAFYGPNQAEAADELESEISNLRAALAFALETDAGSAVCLAADLVDLWVTRGHFAEGRSWLESATSADVATDWNLYRAWHGLGRVCELTSDLAAARAAYSRAIEVAIEISDERAEHRSINALGGVAYLEGDLEQARVLRERFLEHARRTADEASVAMAQNNLASLDQARGDFASALARLEEAVDIARREQATAALAMYLSNGANAAVALLDFTKARALGSEALELHIDLEDPHGEAWSQIILGGLCYVTGEWDRARAHFEASVGLFREVGATSNLSLALSWLAGLLLDLGDITGAEETATESTALKQSLGLIETGAVPARIKWHRGAREEARGDLEDIVQLARPSGALSAVFEPLSALAVFTSLEGDREAAKSYVDETLQAFTGTPLYAPQCLRLAAGVLVGDGRYEEASVLLEAQRSFSEGVGLVAPPDEAALAERVDAEIESNLDLGTLDAARARGRALPVNEAVELARTTVMHR